VPSRERAAGRLATRAENLDDGQVGVEGVGVEGTSLLSPELHRLRDQLRQTHQAKAALERMIAFSSPWFAETYVAKRESAQRGCKGGVLRTCARGSAVYCKDLRLTMLRR
jgi:hypothetical protein